MTKTSDTWNHFRWIRIVCMNIVLETFGFKLSASNNINQTETFIHHQTISIELRHSFSRDTNVSAWFCFKTPIIARVIQEWQLNFIDPYDFALCLLYSIAQRSTVNLLIQQKNRRFSEQVFAYRKWNSPKRNMQKSVPGWFIFML